MFCCVSKSYFAKGLRPPWTPALRGPLATGAPPGAAHRGGGALRTARRAGGVWETLAAEALLGALAAPAGGAISGGAASRAGGGSALTPHGHGHACGGTATR